MYLTHHYLIDVVGGACLATAYFYLFLPDELKGASATAPPGGLASALKSVNGVGGRSKYEIYDLEDPRRRRVGNGSVLDAAEFELSETSSDDEEMDITYRSPGGGDVPTPASAKPLVGQAGGKGGEGGGKKSHRHTASIASLIRGDERGPEDGWSPVTSSFGVAPVTATAAAASRGVGDRDRSRE